MAKKKKKQDDPVIPGVMIGSQFRATGWVRNPDAVRQTIREMNRGRTFEQLASGLISSFNTDVHRFYWESEQQVLGGVLPSWDQGQVGSCVGFGYGRAVQDVMLNEIADGEPEQYPGSEVAPEIIYGGSRFEVGGGQLTGDGSIGAWAARWVKDWGVVPRGQYGTLDVRQYNETTCRHLGGVGIPTDVENLARLHPITQVAQLTTEQGLWSALGAGKGVPVCSLQGFTTYRDSDGYCSLSGSWAHCMVYRGRFVHPLRGRSVIEQNSWGNYLEGGGNPPVQYVKEDGSVGTFVLPEGCFCVELSVAAQSLADQDTFVLAGLTGWEDSGPETDDFMNGSLIVKDGRLVKFVPSSP